jgi:aspartyl-tRNA(Asn)/glutamyl-tRNA(Gln) amidotransferase subunit C
MINIDHVAHLARLGLSPEEKEKFSKQLSKILEYAECLKEVNTKETPPFFQIFERKSFLREDIVVPFEENEKILLNAPEHEENMFSVPKILEE